MEQALPTPQLTRRRMLGTVAALGAANLLALPSALARTIPGAVQNGKAFTLVDSYIADHMKEFFVPGMSLGVASRAAVIGTSGYGLNDLKLKTPVTTSHLFQVGSISKSFVALVLLGLHDEGKLDFQQPIASYLPWLRIKSPFRPITVHDLLTHTSGLARTNMAFPPDAAADIEPGYAPGERYSYSNFAYQILGALIEQLDGRDFNESIRVRIFAPLGMNNSTGIIGNAIRERMATSYEPLFDDRPHPRGGRLREASMLVFDNAAGSVASTPGDMALYLQMLARGGVGPQGRIVSEAAFKLFTTAHTKSAEPGPNAGYGYGIHVDQVDGRAVLHHTGGMPSFSSAIYIDMDAGIGAYVSTNHSQSGYRPTAVAKFVVEALCASQQGKLLPAAPAAVDVRLVPNSKDYAGIYTMADGRTLDILSDSAHLFLKHKGMLVPLELRGPDRFLVLHPDFSMFILGFGRSGGGMTPVVEAFYGADWYAGAGYEGPREFSYPKEWDGYAGTYRRDDGFQTVVVLRKGQLWRSGLVPLLPLAPGLFKPGDAKDTPDRIAFSHPAQGKAWRMRMNDVDCWRVRPG